MGGLGCGGKRLTTKGTLLQTRSNDKQVGMLSEDTVNLVAESKPTMLSASAHKARSDLGA